MNVFKDSTGKEWEVPMSLGSFKRVKDRCDINLLEPHEGTPPLSSRLFNDPFTQGAVLYGLVFPQLEAAGLTEDQFMERLSGEGIAAAAACIQEGLISFFRQIGRPETAAALQKEAELRTCALKKVGIQLGAVDVEAAAQIVADKVQKELDSAMSGISSTSLPVKQEELTHSP